LKSGSLNLLEPSEHVQACDGIGLTLHVYGRIPHIRIHLGLAGGWRQTNRAKRQ